MNIAIIKGNLTRDPELRFTPKGTAVADFAVAVNRVWKDAEGEKKESVSFFDVTAWGNTAETIWQYFRKGKPILVQGRLEQETLDDKETNRKRSRVKIILERFEFCGDNNNTGGEPARERKKAAPKADTAGSDDLPPVEDDVPF